MVRVSRQKPSEATEEEEVKEQQQLPSSQGSSASLRQLTLEEFHNISQQIQPTERTAARMEYRSLMNELDEEREEGGTDMLKKAEKVRTRAGQVFDAKVFQPSEGVFDAKVLRGCTDVAKRQVAQLQTSMTRFERTKFARAVLRWMSTAAKQAGSAVKEEQVSGEDEDDDRPGTSTRRSTTRVAPVPRTELPYILLGEFTQPVLALPPAFNPLYGTFDVDPEPIRQRAQVVRQRRQQLNLPVEKLKEIDLNSEENQAAFAKSSATHQHVDHLYKQMKRAFKHKNKARAEKKLDPEALCFVSFLFVPPANSSAEAVQKGFDQTVQNIFHVAFLLKDGHAKVDRDADGMMTIEPWNQHVPLEQGDNSEDDEEDDFTNHQFILNLSLDQYVDAIDLFDIRERAFPRYTPQLLAPQGGHGGSKRSRRE